MHAQFIYLYQKQKCKKKKKKSQKNEKQKKGSKLLVLFDILPREDIHFCFKIKHTL